MEPVIQLDSVTKRFGPFTALNNVTLNVESGITGLLGPNGAGKSTLIKILLGLLRATNGTARVLGFDLPAQSRQVRSNVGYMPEDDCFLFGLTGIESVQVSAQLSGIGGTEGLRRAHEILDYCGLQQERYRKVETYSTGMRQKLRFAQSIVHDPDLLILDEPTSGLDPEEREIMLRRIRQLANDHGKTVLICTHILPDVQAVSEHLIIVAGGEVRLADRLENLNRPSSPSMTLRVTGNQQAFQDRLKQENISTIPNERGTILVEANRDDLTDVVWRTAKDTDTIIRAMKPSMNSLEEIFLEAVQVKTGGQAVGDS